MKGLVSRESLGGKEQRLAAIHYSRCDKTGERERKKRDLLSSINYSVQVRTMTNAQMGEAEFQVVALVLFSQFSFYAIFLLLLFQFVVFHHSGSWRFYRIVSVLSGEMRNNETGSTEKNMLQIR